MFWLLILAGIIAGAGSLEAQRYLGGISGTVADQTGAILPGAQWRLSKAARNSKRSQMRRRRRLLHPSLSPGTYAVSVTVAGFKTERKAT